MNIIFFFQISLNNYVFNHMFFEYEFVLFCICFLFFVFLVLLFTSSWMFPFLSTEPDVLVPFVSEPGPSSATIRTVSSLIVCNVYLAQNEN